MTHGYGCIWWWGNKSPPSYGIQMRPIWMEWGTVAYFGKAHMFTWNVQPQTAAYLTWSWVSLFVHGISYMWVDIPNKNLTVAKDMQPFLQKGLKLHDLKVKVAATHDTRYISAWELDGQVPCHFFRESSSKIWAEENRISGWWFGTWISFLYIYWE